MTSSFLASELARAGYAVVRAGADPAHVAAVRDAVAAEMAGVCQTAGATWAELHDCPFSAAQMATIRARVATVPEVTTLVESAQLRGVVSSILGEPDVFCHPRRFLRMSSVTTSRDGLMFPWHQDYRFVQGSRSVLTAWIPLDRCISGSLDLVPGSHQAGLLPLTPATGGALPFAVRYLGEYIAAPELRPGDVLFFSSLLLHRTSALGPGEHGRISLDLRYQSVREPISEAALISVGGEPVDDARLSAVPRVRYVDPQVLE